MMMTANSGLKQAIAPLEAEAEDMVISTILAEIEFKNVHLSLFISLKELMALNVCSLQNFLIENHVD